MWIKDCLATQWRCLPNYVSNYETMSSPANRLHIMWHLVAAQWKVPGRPGFRCCKNVCLLTFENHNLSLFILFCCNLCCFDAIYAVLMHYMLFYCNMCYFIAIHAVFVCHFIAIYAVLSRRHDCCKIRAFPGTLGVVPRHFQLLLMSAGRTA